MKKIFKLISIILICVCVSSCKNKFKDGVYDGEYEEETQYVTYTANVEVTVKNNKITKVILMASNIHSDPELWSGYMAWTEHHQALLNSYVGLNVNDVINADKSPVDVLSGATLSSNRLFYAIKDALID